MLVFLISQSHAQENANPFEVQVSVTPTPEQQRIKTMQAQIKRAQDAVRAERARQKTAAGQKQLAKL